MEAVEPTRRNNNQWTNETDKIPIAISRNFHSCPFNTVKRRHCSRLRFCITFACLGFCNWQKREGECEWKPDWNANFKLKHGWCRLEEFLREVSFVYVLVSLNSFCAISSLHSNSIISATKDFFSIVGRFLAARKFRGINYSSIPRRQRKQPKRK